MKPKVKEAFYGWDIAKANHGLAAAVLIVSVVVIGFLAFAYAAFNPVEVAVGPVENLVTAGQCPSGWHDNSADDVDAVVKSCERDGWVVFLDAGGEFSHAYQQDTPGAEFVMEASEVPGWAN